MWDAAYGVQYHRSRRRLKDERRIVLLLRVNAEGSDHRIRAVVAVWFQPALGGNRRHTGGTLVCLSRRAVARPMRPRRNPCHCRANHRWFAIPCGLVWGRPLTDSVASVTTGATVFTLPGQTSRVSLNLRLKTEVCACISINACIDELSHNCKTSCRTKLRRMRSLPKKLIPSARVKKCGLWAYNSFK